MIPEAREVRLRPKIRKVLEARCRAPSTPQGDLKRAQIVLLAAEGRSTRSIAKEVGVQPHIVSKWRHRFADHGLAGLNDRPRASKKPIYSQATNRRILALLDKPPPPGYARWTGPLLAMALQDVDVQYVWRFLREHNIDLAARKSWCESNDPEFAAKAADVVGLYIDPPAKAMFAESAARAAGKSTRTIQREVERAAKIPDLADAVGTTLDNADELDTLAKLPPPVQSDLIARAKSGDSVTAKPVAKQSVR